MTARTRTLFAALALGAVLLSGCGDRPRGKLHGTIRYNGKPVDNGLVVFMGSDNLTYTADLNPDGTYSTDRVPHGTVKVCIQQAPPRPASRPAPREGDGGGDARDQKAAEAASKPRGVVLPPQYADPDKSGLMVEVKSPDQEWSPELK